MIHDSFPANDGSSRRQNGVSAGDIAEAVLEFYIEGEDDLIGLLAYALYERQKRDFVLSHRKRNAGRSPDEAELAAVNSNYLSTDLRNTLRDRASQILSSYAETYVEAMEPQIRLTAVNSDALRQVRNIEKSIKRRLGFWRQVRAGFAVTLLLLLLFGAAAIAAVFFQSDIVDAWKALMVPTTLRT
ncbi:hypothetical protein E0I74_14745 [Rhizobium laguerreae]|jgi:hypothetical protein|uniref:Uncharacterized protein n=1 Tax=Rhizobium laguerreae TaxID=1076926 RepID=A0A1S9GVU2_9HYPH|nr:hypothetical protein [Rhizobium laguerreae]MBB3166412.1 hypothetical protein [Rhizobium laguerreae]MBN9986284.1 hypothetical protein [Rhizobium laguerreae]MBY3065285.1 hypothetical protein [Rhizobium laguerreae]MBY3071492.1 hypothetical protein [Rhizobium laguerreae]MBY3082161.1 hypothetical protein [Rhizobium laguerreae]